MPSYLRTQLVFTPDPVPMLQGNLELLRQFDAEVGVAVEQTRTEIEPKYLDDLRFTPQSVKYPIAWTSPKQEWHVKKVVLQGKPYTRTGKLAAGWSLSLTRNEGTYRYRALNTTEYTRWVVGNLRRDDRRNTQQRFHAASGWKRVKDTVNYWYAVFTDETSKRLFERIRTVNGITTRRVSGNRN